MQFMCIPWRDLGTAIQNAEGFANAKQIVEGRVLQITPPFTLSGTGDCTPCRSLRSGTALLFYSPQSFFKIIFLKALTTFGSKCVPEPSFI